MYSSCLVCFGFFCFFLFFVVVVFFFFAFCIQCYIVSLEHSL